MVLVGRAMLVVITSYIKSHEFMYRVTSIICKVKRWQRSKERYWRSTG